jgi:hypothetical protein
MLLGSVEAELLKSLDIVPSFFPEGFGSKIEVLCEKSFKK